MPYDVANITICSASKEELPIVVDLAERIWPQVYHKFLSDGQIRYMLKMLYDLPVLKKEYAAGTRFDLVFDGGEPIGFASYGPCPVHPHFCAKLHKLYLDTKYHGRGIGTMVLCHIIKETRDREYRVLHLNVNKKNQTAIQAYERNGFHKIEESVTDIGGGFIMDDYIMEIKL
ncbi:MAG: GNAT family N-acetyltransferase [Victivallales bacterium]|jgi:ribosomal protein S18 acetylase RimI-like enzyme|nr:GNAT family N-acetyltransferase [Victivallales bacterium]